MEASGVFYAAFDSKLPVTDQGTFKIEGYPASTVYSMPLPCLYHASTTPQINTATLLLCHPSSSTQRTTASCCISWFRDGFILTSCYSCTVFVVLRKSFL